MAALAKGKQYKYNTSKTNFVKKCVQFLPNTVISMPVCICIKRL